MKGFVTAMNGGGVKRKSGTVEEAFNDVKHRRYGLIKALTTGIYISSSSSLSIYMCVIYVYTNDMSVFNLI